MKKQILSYHEKLNALANRLFTMDKEQQALHQHIRRFLNGNHLTYERGVLYESMYSGDKRIEIFMYAIVESCTLFGDWAHRRPDLQPYWAENKNKDPIESTIQYYGITWDELQHLFCIGKQKSWKYGGVVTLKEDSRPQDIAHLIWNFLKHHNFNKRIMLTEKFKTIKITAYK